MGAPRPARGHRLPAITTYHFYFGPIVLSGSPGTAYAPRRTILDKLLLDAAAEAGAEVRESFTLKDVLTEDGRVTGISGHDRGGRTIAEHARVVVGADGKHSRIAAAVAAPSYHDKPPAEGAYYAYWSGLPTSSFELYIRPERVTAAIPTNDDQTLVLASWPASEFDAFRADVEGNFVKTLELTPAFAERVTAATRESRFHSSGELPGFFRQPYGPGWALVGDAGHTTDPSTAQGISDAFWDAEGLAAALDEALSGRRSYDEVLGAHHRARDEAMTPMYELTFDLATLEPPPPEMQQILAAAAGNQTAMDAFAQMFAGVLPVPDFFAPAHVESIMKASVA